MKSRKGFTLVELLVVIAILAILATASIIGFTAFTKKAQVSNDSELVTQLNKYAQAASVSKDFKTVTEMRDELIESGFELANLKLEAEKQGYVIGFDIAKDRFVLLKDAAVAEGYTVEKNQDVFAFVRTQAEATAYGNAKFSLYLQNGFAETSLEAKTGVDVGENTGITAISYDRHLESGSQEVVIRTNSANTALNINAPADTIKHYGAVGSLNIAAVANASYHEFGQVAFAEIATGRIVLESDSKVEHIHLTATGGNFVDITVAKANDVEMPEFSRDPVEIPAAGKLVVALQDGTEKDDNKDYVWLTAVGIYEQVTVSDSKTEAKDNFAATSTTASQEQKTAAQQIANNITFEAAGEDYKVTAKTTDGGSTWTYEVVDQNGTVSEDYSAEKHNTENTVEVKTSGENPEVVVTTKENGLNEESKNNLKDDLVITAKADEQIGEQLLGIKTISINTESIDVYLPVNTSDGSLALEDIQHSTLVPFEFNFAGGVSFIAPESINEEWNNATADFVISFDKDINPISSFNYNYNNAQHEASRENVKILPVIGVGKFGNNATSFWEKYKNMWLPCPITSDGYKANEEITLLKDVFTSVGFDGVSVNCQELVNCIKEFSCGLVFLQDIGEVTITVKLVVTNNNTKYVVGSQQFTFNSADYVTTCPSEHIQQNN